MLVRSPLLTSHKWRELASSGCLVCRCQNVFLWCYLCFVLLRFYLYAFVEAAALRSIVLRYAGAPIATRVSFFFSFVYLEMSLFLSIFCTIAVFSLYIESTSYVLSFRMVFYLVTTGWSFYISLCENSTINQSKPMGLRVITVLPVVTKYLPVSSRCTTYDFLSRCKFSTLTTRQPVDEHSRSHAFRYGRKIKNLGDKKRTHNIRTSRRAGYILDYEVLTE